MSDNSILLEHVADLYQRIYIALLPALTEHWMATYYTMPQLKVMLSLFTHGPYRVGDLASTLGVSTPTVTGIIDRLVKQGAVNRDHSIEDRRVVTCTLSPAGENQIADLWTARFGVYREIFGALPPEGLEIVARAAEVVLKAAEERNARSTVNGTAT